MNTKTSVHSLIKKVEAAEQDVLMAVTFHETWKPTAYDEDLHKRLGKSYAANSFFIVRQALRREMLLALMRPWDVDEKTVDMQRIAKELNTPVFFEELVAHRARSRYPAIQLGPSAGLPPVRIDELYRAALSECRDEFCALVSKYTKGGDAHSVFKKLLVLRHENLAHRKAEPSTTTYADVTDAEIEAFYNDNLEIARLLLSLALAKALDFAEAGDVYKYHARFFWAGVCGERTEGHPDYRPPIQMAKGNL